MTDLNCQQADELAPAAALGDRELGSAVARHLQTCRQEHAETRQVLAAVDALPAAVLPVAPRPQLRARLMATIAETPQGHGAMAPRRNVAGEPSPQAAPRDWLAWLRPGLARGIALAAIPVVVVLAVVAIQLQSQVSARDATLQAVAQALSHGDQVLSVKGSAGAGYLVRGQDDRATLLAAGLGSPPSGHLYEMWLIDDAGTAIPAGTFVPADADISVVDVTGSIGSAATFAVTVEQQRVEQPTSDPVLVADLSQ